MKRIIQAAALISAAILFFAESSVWASSQPWWSGDVLTSKSSGKKQIALTFDDGPHSTLTNEILDILDKFNVKATFFVVGENAVLYPEQIRREIDEGHEIGNHTYKHTILKNKSTAEINEEITNTEDVLYEICEYRTKLLRPPGGLYRDNLCSFAEKNDYTVVLWSVDTRDWAHRPAEKIYEKIVDRVQDGDIILCHDYISGKSPTPELLKKLIPALLSHGFEFVTVSHLLNS